MVGRKVTVEFPMPCDRCGRTIRPGEVVAQRIYPHKTYVTHIVCPGRSAQRGNKYKHSHENQNTNKE